MIAGVAWVWVWISDEVSVTGVVVSGSCSEENIHGSPEHRPTMYSGSGSAGLGSGVNAGDEGSSCGSSSGSKTIGGKIGGGESTRAGRLAAVGNCGKSTGSSTSELIAGSESTLAGRLAAIGNCSKSMGSSTGECSGVGP